MSAKKVKNEKNREEERDCSFTGYYLDMKRKNEKTAVARKTKFILIGSEKRLKTGMNRGSSGSNIGRKETSLTSNENNEQSDLVSKKSKD